MSPGIPWWGRSTKFWEVDCKERYKVSEWFYGNMKLENHEQNHKRQALTEPEYTNGACHPY